MTQRNPCSRGVPTCTPKLEIEYQYHYRNVEIPDPWLRYERDNEFRALVDTLEAFMAKAQFAPSELREAAVLAAIKFETRRQRTMIVRKARP